MIIPPLLIGCSVIFWGAQTDNLLIGCLLGLVLESRHIITTRFAFDTEDFVKISDLSSLLLLGSVALVLLNYEATSFLRLTAGWLPLTLSPLIAAQLYSGSDTVTIGTRFGKKKQNYAHKPIDFRVYYIVICLFAAATGNSRSSWFFIIMGGIIMVLVFCNRGKASSPLSFITLLILCLIMGYVGSIAFASGHRYVIRKSYKMFYNYYHSQHVDPYKSHINFGDTGRLKYSGQIVMRVAASTLPSALFREAVYSTYHRGDWFGNERQYSYLSPVKQQQWNLIKPPHKEGERLTVEFGLPREQGLLPYPYGGYSLSSSTIFRIEQHENGSVRVVDGAPLLIYDIDFEPSMDKKDDEPRATHLSIPQNELYALKQAYSKVEAAGQNDAAKVAALKRYFDNDFRYSLELLGRGDFATSLGNFLLQKKSGFCEYYATATALLLRYMNIPSRYAIGYAVFEKSALENKYVVRDRHAHAWAEAFVDGRWIVVDTTPPDWDLRDAENGSFLEPLWDVLNLLRHKYRLYQVGATKDYTPVFTAIVVALIAFLTVKIYRRMRMERAATDVEEDEQRFFDRIITPFTPVMDSLTSLQGSPRERESIARWAQRSGCWPIFDEQEFEQLYLLHLQSRFDSAQMPEEQQEALKKGAEKYLEGLNKV